jgi:hypothetical protein
MSARTCCKCDAPCDESRICDPCLRKWVTESRAAQGLPPTVEDPKTLARIGRLMRGEAA